jgi:hypothetical protein
MPQVARQRDEDWLAMLFRAAAFPGVQRHPDQLFGPRLRSCLLSSLLCCFADRRRGKAQGPCARRGQRRGVVATTPIDERNEYVRLVEDLTPIDKSALGIAIAHEAAGGEGSPRPNFDDFAQRSSGDRHGAQCIVMRLHQRVSSGRRLAEGWRPLKSRVRPQACRRSPRVRVQRPRGVVARRDLMSRRHNG